MQSFAGAGTIILLDWRAKSGRLTLSSLPEKGFASMKKSQIVSLVMLVFLAAWAGTRFGAVSLNEGGSSAGKETAFDRVIRTNTLRCGYLVMPPQFVRDPNTGGFSGISYDIAQQAATRLGLNVEWVEEVNFMTVAEALKAGRIDALCFTSYRWLPAEKAMDYSTPLFYSTTKAYVRADDNRFDADLSAVNDPQTTVATLEGEASVTIRDEMFPKSKAFSLPANTDYSLVMETLRTGKADIVFSNPIMVMPYLVANASVVKVADQGHPVRIYSHAFSFAKNEQSLLNMFNAAFDEMIADGTMNKILDKYETIPDSFVRIAQPVAIKGETGQ